LKAVRDHDPDAAEIAMRKHMQAVLDRLKSQEFTNAK
jgi:DNA-binding FadR family transcriptional regulator